MEFFFILPMHNFQWCVFQNKNQEFITFSSRDICRRKKFPEHFIFSTTMSVVHSEHGKNHLSTSMGICLHSFRKVLHSASFQKKNIVLSFSQSQISANVTNILQHHAHLYFQSSKKHQNKTTETFFTLLM